MLKYCLLFSFLGIYFSTNFTPFYQSELHSCHCTLQGFPVLEVSSADLLCSPAWCSFWQMPFLNCDLDCRQGLNWISSFPELLALNPLSAVVGWLCRGVQVHSWAVLVQGMPGQGRVGPVQGLEPFSSRMVLWDAAGACPWHWCSSSNLDVPQQAFFTQMLQSGKKPDLPILCQIIIDSGESLFMQWVTPLISVGGPRCSSENPECWGNNTFFPFNTGIRLRF